MKKFLSLVVGLLALGFLFVTAQEKSQTQTQAQEKAQVKTQSQAQVKTQANVQAKTQVKSQFRHQNRIAFVDENGDGINDLARDADGDGIPNCQDPDWTRPLDGSGYKAQAGKGKVTTDATATAAAGTGNAFQLARDDDGDGIPNGQDPDWTRPLDGSGYKGQHKFAKASFRTGMTGAARVAGTGVCDGTGPKGTAQRKGRR